MLGIQQKLISAMTVFGLTGINRLTRNVSLELIAHKVIGLRASLPSCVVTQNGAVWYADATAALPSREG